MINGIDLNAAGKTNYKTRVRVKASKSSRFGRREMF